MNIALDPLWRRNKEAAGFEAAALDTSPPSNHIKDYKMKADAGRYV